MSTGQTYLITGAARGIGRGLVAAFLQLPSTTIVAAVRDPTKESALTLNDLPRASNSKLIVIQIDSANEKDPDSAVALLRKEHGIESLDIVIANAGISHSGGPVGQTSTNAATEHFVINSIGPINLFQAVAPLLNSSKAPKFIAISSLIGTISGQELLRGTPPQLSPYGASKAALNWFIRRLHEEEDWLTTFVVHPGLVLTDMVAASFAAGDGVDPKDFGAISVAESVESISKIILSATKDVGGTFQNYNGSTLPW